ncbi:hypothetical protein BDV27DRAFT_159376 [Aspergillus caelatus]|uniref:DNA2/NAM7 helicase-like C-terminal domain-containing protein n=1 Tax=Aspergillus caelatus TaxID=61420 RepID=A0A5N7A0V1_9EURO|nr:uncharacterized protein BDV27DRAFT_159376 [Aspergillus caelatus]KAE8362819.1 hypothetical protein BDV27DRAFT_159376 [Aspergillus caelatus]
MREVYSLEERENIDLGNIVVSVEGSSCIVDDASKSRHNDAHRLHILRLLIANKKHSGYPASDITIVTLYQAQAARIRHSLFRIKQYGLLDKTSIPKVATTDSMQGKESKVILYDRVISSANNLYDMGFTVDEHRATVGLTRMTEAMVNLLPESVGTGQEAVSPRGQYDYLEERINSKMPYPCEFRSWAQSKRIVLTVQCPSEEDIIPAPQEPMQIVMTSNI